MEVSAETHLSPSSGPRVPSAGMLPPPMHGRAHLGADAATREGGGQVEGETRQQLESELARQRSLLDKAMLDRRKREGALVPGKVADAAEVEELRQSLVAFYSKVNPSKLANVDTIVNDFAARGGGGPELDALNEDLRTVYQCDLSSVTPPGGFGAAQHAPSSQPAAYAGPQSTVLKVSGAQPAFYTGPQPTAAAPAPAPAYAPPASFAAAAPPTNDFSGMSLGDKSFQDAEPPSFHGAGDDEDVIFDEL